MSFSSQKARAELECFFAVSRNAELVPWPSLKKEVTNCEVKSRLRVELAYGARLTIASQNELNSA